MILSDLFNTPKLVRYGIVLVGIFLLLKLIPNAQINTRDAAVSSIVIFALYVVVENIFTKASICGSEKLDGQISLPNQSLSTMVPNQVSSSLPAIQEPSSTQVAQVQQVQQVQQTQQTQPYAMKPGECKDCVKKITDSNGMDAYVYKTNTQKYASGPTRAQEGVISSEVQYTEYNILPVTPEDSKLYEYGYSFLPPEKWFPVPPHPPVCVSEKKCPICPVTTTGTPVDMKEWNDSRRITPGDVINIDYAKDVLNSGR